MGKGVWGRAYVRGGFRPHDLDTYIIQCHKVLTTQCIKTKSGIGYLHYSMTPHNKVFTIGGFKEEGWHCGGVVYMEKSMYDRCVLRGGGISCVGGGISCVILEEAIWRYSGAYD